MFSIINWFYQQTLFPEVLQSHGDIVLSEVLILFYHLWVLYLIRIILALFIGLLFKVRFFNVDNVQTTQFEQLFYNNPFAFIVKAPFIEEIAFRIMPLCFPSWHYYMVYSTFIFGFSHISNCKTMDITTTMTQSIMANILGFYLGWLVMMYGVKGMYYALFVHILNNAIAYGLVVIQLRH